MENSLLNQKIFNQLRNYLFVGFNEFGTVNFTASIDATEVRAEKKDSGSTTALLKVLEKPLSDELDQVLFVGIILTVIAGIVIAILKFGMIHEEK